MSDVRLVGTTSGGEVRWVTDEPEGTPLLRVWRDGDPKMQKRPVASVIVMANGGFVPAE